MAYALLLKTIAKSRKGPWLLTLCGRRSGRPRIQNRQLELDSRSSPRKRHDQGVLAPATCQDALGVSFVRFRASGAKALVEIRNRGARATGTFRRTRFTFVRQLTT